MNESSNAVFQYQTIEVEDEYNPLISILTKGECYKITSPWIESEIVLIDNKTEMVKKLIKLRDDMKEVIERYIQKGISIYELNTIEKIIKKIIEVD